MKFIDRLRSAWNRYQIRRRRRKLISAYAKVGRAKHDLGPGFTPTMYALDQILNHDLAAIVEVDGEHELVWTWPEDAPDAVDQEVIDVAE